MLAGHVSHGAVGRLEGLGAERTLVEDLAVLLVDVHFEQGQGHEDNSTMDAPGEAGQRAELQPQQHFHHTQMEGPGCGGSLIGAVQSLPYSCGRVKEEYDTGILVELTAKC